MDFYAPASYREGVPCFMTGIIKGSDNCHDHVRISAKQKRFRDIEGSAKLGKSE